MQNMKLLDLQTGKYLELGGDWSYCGKYIIFHNYPKEYIDDHNEDYDTNDSGYIHNGFEAIIYWDHGRSMNIEWLYSEPQEPLKTLCEQTGAVVYGDRYVLFENKECGNIYCEKNKWGTVYYLNKDIYSFIPCPEFNLENDKKQTVARFFSLDNCQDNVIGNLFEEYSKQLRNEPNKFEELLELIK